MLVTRFPVEDESAPLCESNVIQRGTRTDKVAMRTEHKADIAASYADLKAGLGKSRTG